MTEAYIPVLNTLITSGISLAVAFGTWHVTIRKDREKQTEEVRKILNDHREEYLSGIQDVKDEVKSVKSTVELNQALTNEKIDTLSERVEKHNGVIERTLKLETEMAVAKEEIGIIRNNVDAIRRG